MTAREAELDLSSGETAESLLGIMKMVSEVARVASPSGLLFEAFLETAARVLAESDDIAAKQQGVTVAEWKVKKLQKILAADPGFAGPMGVEIDPEDYSSGSTPMLKELEDTAEAAIGLMEYALSFCSEVSRKGHLWTLFCEMIRISEDHSDKCNSQAAGMALADWRNNKLGFLRSKYSGFSDFESGELDKEVERAIGFRNLEGN